MYLEWVIFVNKIFCVNKPFTKFIDVTLELLIFVILCPVLLPNKTFKTPRTNSNPAEHKHNYFHAPLFKKKSLEYFQMRCALTTSTDKKTTTWARTVMFSARS